MRAERVRAFCARAALMRALQDAYALCCVMRAARRCAMLRAIGSHASARRWRDTLAADAATAVTRRHVAMPPFSATPLAPTPYAYVADVDVVFVCSADDVAFFDARRCLPDFLFIAAGVIDIAIVPSSRSFTRIDSILVVATR